MSYKVKEVFYSLQGEGLHTGRPSIFCRFTGCNLWSGKESDRSSAKCNFCDTDFVGTDGEGGGSFITAEDLVKHLLSFYPINSNKKPVFEFTGGEPLLQLDAKLIEVSKKNNATLCIETNGTQPIPEGIDWVCISPKAKVPLVAKKGDEIKIIFPQEGLNPKDYEDLNFDHFYLQPKDDSENLGENRKKTIEYCLNNPKWRLSMQIHKTLEIL